MSTCLSVNKRSAVRMKIVHGFAGGFHCVCAVFSERAGLMDVPEGKGPCGDEEAESGARTSIEKVGILSGMLT